MCQARVDSSPFLIWATEKRRGSSRKASARGPLVGKHSPCFVCECLHLKATPRRRARANNASNSIGCRPMLPCCHIRQDSQSNTKIAQGSPCCGDVDESVNLHEANMDQSAERSLLYPMCIFSYTIASRMQWLKSASAHTHTHNLVSFRFCCSQ